MLYVNVTTQVDRLKVIGYQTENKNHVNYRN